MVLSHVMVLACVMVLILGMVLTMTRDGQEDAGKEYAVHADYAHIHEYADADLDQNLIQIIHVQIFDIFWARSGSAWLYFQF